MLVSGVCCLCVGLGLMWELDGFVGIFNGYWGRVEFFWGNYFILLC